MSFETEGSLHKIFETQSKSDTFQTREFVIKQDGNYPQFIKFQLTQDRCDLISNHKEGDRIKVSFDLRGREWNEKFFTNLNAWRIDAAAAVESAEPPMEKEPAVMSPLGDFKPPVNESQNLSAEDFDDLPF